MTHRSRPAPRRRQRARWQDELRTQRLLIGAFAAAIAVALGLFGMSAWTAYYDGNLRQVIVVEGTAVSREGLDLRQAIIGAELQATAVDLQGQLGGTAVGRPPTARDALLQQQLQAISDQFSNLTSAATGSIVDGLFQASRADELGIDISPEEVDTEVADRKTLPARVQLSIIVVDALPDDAEVGAEPTEEDFARAEEEATEILAELEGGGEFATIATEQSDDAASAQAGGLVGWVAEEDVQYGYLFPLAEGVEIDELAGPSRTETGYVVLRVEDRTEAGPFTELVDLLNSARVTDADYRAYVTDDLMRLEFRAYFDEEVVVSPAPQREVAQILVLNDEGIPVPKLRVRHLLAQPLPGADDQSAATEEQWQAALDRAEAWYEEVQDPDADWFEIALDSDDPGSRENGGDLGWYDPTSGGFVPEVEDTIADLGVDEISEPVESDFGYHVIQVTDQRSTALGFAEDMIAELQADPDAFGETARTDSEDASTREDDGYFGWVAHYEVSTAREDAIFGLTDIGEISSEPVIDGNQIWIFQLLDSAEARSIDEDRLSTIRSVGFSRWYDELKANGEIWIDTLLQTAPAPAA
ncbi:MAG TPA: peptidylprolyl isomerase [Candidatus Limnocylindria bacterium]|nr:peptidylprolyl isomerase [Candidatus Limnocylindria bacterium]